MTEKKYSVEQDLKEAQSMADALVPYVYQDQLYMPVSGGGMFSPMPAMTIGALLMRLRRLRALSGQLTPEQQARVSAVDEQNRKAWNEWRVHYENKIIEEANSRLKLLSTYVNECKEDSRACANNYPAEALRRTIVQEISEFMDVSGAHSAELDRNIKRVDSPLRGFARPSEFIWASVLEPVYPRDTFWWLYNKPD
jgi:hypothetical protein